MAEKFRAGAEIFLFFRNFQAGFGAKLSIL
jgi:hypothetical protein